MVVPKESTAAPLGVERHVETLADVLDVARAGPGGVVGADGSFVQWSDVADRADRLAHTLGRVGAASGDRIAVLLPKSVESFIAMHAVLRAGFVAVPLNPLSTRRATAPTLAITTPAVIVTTAALAERLLEPAQPDVALIVVGDHVDVARRHAGPVVSWDVSLADRSSERALRRPQATDDAYIIFTSGSTGEPKGMVHTHRSGLEYATSAIAVHELDADTRLAGTAPLHFDMSTLELYSVPLAGSVALTVTEADQRFPATLGSMLVEQRATHLYAVPSLLHQLVHRGDLEQLDLGAIRHVAFAGEPMGAALLGRLMDALPEAGFVNAYGPAELNVVTSHVFERDWDRTTVPIGSAWPGVRLDVVDDSGKSVTDGVVGELIVSAESCMRGYWNLDAETATRITEDEQGRRWYRTGDRVHVDDGVVHFVGRNDNQVKVRGVRIEVEAVEHALCTEPSVVRAVVAPVTDAEGMTTLHAWVVVRPGDEFDERAVLRWCRARLAAAAVPSSCLAVDDLPVTPNGKIDRQIVGTWADGARSQDDVRKPGVTNAGR